MKLKALEIDRFGPFSSYRIEFPKENNVCLLLTGHNNEGKSTIIKALKLLHAAAAIGRRQASPVTNKILRKMDVEDIDIGRSIHDYEGGVATIKGIFYNDSEITVNLDEDNNSIYADYSTFLPQDISEIFAFIPPLGQIAETEDVITHQNHLKKSLNTSLAPRHLRNHFHQYLSPEQFNLVKTIISDSWDGIQLNDYVREQTSNRLFCTYMENGQEREISWAGQGLQIWFQIVTHLVRQLDTSILVLDEPEVFLHTRKQLDLIQMLREYYSGSIIIATHSIELMNHVDISHIIHVKKAQSKPTIKSSTNRSFLDHVRAQMGSSFNLIASQFEDVDILVFTEGAFDYDVICRFARLFGMHKRVFNVPLGGFSEYKKAIPMKEAYKVFFGKSVRCTVFLDRDYYPVEYLEQVKQELDAKGLTAVFTPGKETENLLLDRELLFSLLPTGTLKKPLESFLNKLFEKEYNNCFGSLLELHEHFPPGAKNSSKTILKKQKPLFDKQWNHANQRYSLISGKSALTEIREFFQQNYKMSLPTSLLIEQSANSQKGTEIQKLVEDIFQL